MAAVVPAEAATCGPHDQFALALKAQFKETRRDRAIVNTGLLLEVYRSPAGTFTILLTGSNGISCISASGYGWQDESPPDKEAQRRPGK